MSSGWLDFHRPRFDPSKNGAPGNAASSEAFGLSDQSMERLRARVRNATRRTRQYLIDHQHADGYWVGELEGDTILESEYVLLLAYLKQGQCETARLAANYILQQQIPEGGWTLYPGGPLELSASVKAYFALKITGHSPDAEYMQRARQAILDAGGAERVNSFTRFYLALLGVISYDQCPAVPPELSLLPKWFPLSLQNMSAWSRTIVVPLSLMWAHRPSVQLPEERGIRELFRTAPEALSACMAPSTTLDPLKSKRWINWSALFRLADRGIKLLDSCHIRPFRRAGIRRTAAWMLKRFSDSDGLGAIFPPIVWSVVALKCLGYDDNSPEVRDALHELDKLMIREGDSIRLQPCKSPVWDTAIATIALRDAAVPETHDSIQRSVQWLLDREVRVRGDWAKNCPDCEPSGWFFEFRNKFYPDVDDTAMVLIALQRCLPDGNWSADVLVDDWSPHEADKDAAAIVAGRFHSPEAAYQAIERIRNILTALHRGGRWLFSMQNRDGGWGAFDVDNDREILTRLPFADHNAMIDPSTADLTARVLEMYAGMGLTPQHPKLRHAVEFLWKNQEPDFCWFGRWGVNYIYGTWQTLVGLCQLGISRQDPRIRKAVSWLKSRQQESGGWGETCASYDNPVLRGDGVPTASQTAWALMGLIAAGEGRSISVRRGIRYLLDTQRDDGTWEEPQFTGTGFPRVFYLKYHLYSVYFPLMAVSRYRSLYE